MFTVVWLYIFGNVDGALAFTNFVWRNLLSGDSVQEYSTIVLHYVLNNRAIQLAHKNVGSRIYVLIQTDDSLKTEQRGRLAARLTISDSSSALSLISFYLDSTLSTLCIAITFSTASKPFSFARIFIRAASKAFGVYHLPSAYIT